MYVEQSPLSVPKGLRGEIKRPDFLVGVPSIGTIAFDVKAKSVYDDRIFIDADEHRTFQNFETFFNISVWYVCFPPTAPTTCHLFLNRDLKPYAVRAPHRQSVLAMSLKETVTADTRRDFMAAVLAAIKQRSPVCSLRTSPHAIQD